MLYDDTNGPLRRSSISLVQLPERGNFSGATDRNGKFEIRDVMIVSTDPGKWSFPTQRMMQVTDANGIVTFSGAPGDYLVIIAGENDSWPPSVEAIRAAAQTTARISLKSGENKTITVRID